MKRKIQSYLLVGAAILLFSISCSSSLDNGNLDLPLALTSNMTELSVKSDPTTALSAFKFLAWNNSGSDHSKFVYDDSTEDGYTEVESSSVPAVTGIEWTNPLNKNFFAYSCGNNADLPSGFEVSSEDYRSQVLSCEIPLNGSLDIVLGAYTGEGTVSGGTRIAHLKFQHPFTSIVAIKGKISDIDAIKSITIKGVYKSGKVSQSFDGSGNPVIGDWTPLDGTSFETGNIVINMGSGLPVSDIDEGDPLLPEILVLIPQSGTNLDIEMVVSTSSGDRNVRGTLASFNWEAGKTNKITINLNEDSSTLNFTSTVSKWEDVDVGEKIAEEMNLGDYVQLWDGGPYWATCNLGANNPWEYGDYYLWGAVEPIHLPFDYASMTPEYGKYDISFSFHEWPLDYTEKRYPNEVQIDLTKGFDAANTPYLVISGHSFYLTKYSGSDYSLARGGVPDGKFVLDEDDDAAVYKSSGLLRYPNRVDINGLLTKCHFEQEDNYENSGIAGVLVYKMKGEDASYDYSSDEHIFIPAAGYAGGSDISLNGEGVYFMTNYMEDNPESIAAGIGAGMFLDVQITESYRGEWIGVKTWAIPVRPVLK